MDQVGKRKNLIMLAIVTIIVIYAAVSVFWIIRDMDTGQTVFVISSNLPQSGNIQQGNFFLDKIKHLIKLPEKVLVPVQRKLTIKGQVIYTNGSPFANGLVELQSNPRITYTDGDGYFIFENVEDGKHTIKVFGKNMEVLASCEVFINRNMDISDLVLVQLEDGTWVMEIAVNLEILGIVLEIEQEAAGQTSGKMIIYKDVKDSKDNPSEEKPGDLPEQEEPINPEDSPEQEEPKDPEIPVPDKPNPPLNPPDSSEGENQSGGNNSGQVTPTPPPASKLTVYSTNDKTAGFSKQPAPVADINIFGKDKRIAPGMRGQYTFTVDNTANPFAIYYDINFIETNNHLKIPMKYRLKDNKTDTYVTGDIKWHTVGEISVATSNTQAPLNMNHFEKVNYTLEWLWEDGGISDTTYGKDHGGKIVCTLTIKVSAQRK